MRKTIVIAIIFSFLFSCGSTSSVPKIDRYVKKIDKQKKLTEIITEYTIEESSEHDLTGNGDVSVLTDNDGKICRIIANDNESHHKPANYKFYYQDNILVFSNLIVFNKKRTDTISDIDYYFADKKLIKKKNRKENDIHSEFIIETSEYYKRHYEK